MNRLLRFSSSPVSSPSDPSVSSSSSLLSPSRSLSSEMLARVQALSGKKFFRSSPTSPPQTAPRSPDYSPSPTSPAPISISSFLSDPSLFPLLLDYVAADGLAQQELLFIIEVNQLLGKVKDLDSMALLLHSIKIMNVFIRTGGSAAASGLPAVQPLAQTRTQLEATVPMKMPSAATIESAGGKQDIDVILTLLEVAKSEVEMSLGRRVGRGFLEYYSLDALGRPMKDCAMTDVLEDEQLYRSFLLHLLESRRQRKLVYWAQAERIRRLSGPMDQQDRATITECIRNMYPTLVPSFDRARLAAPIDELLSDLSAPLKDLESTLQTRYWPQFLHSSHFVEYQSHSRASGLGSPTSTEKKSKLKSLIATLKQNEATQEILALQQERGRSVMIQDEEEDARRILDYVCVVKLSQPLFPASLLPAGAAAGPQISLVSRFPSLEASASENFPANLCELCFPTLAAEADGAGPGEFDSGGVQPFSMESALQSIERPRPASQSAPPRLVPQPFFSFVACVAGSSVYGGCVHLEATEETRTETLSAPVKEGSGNAESVESWDLNNFLDSSADSASQGAAVTVNLKYQTIHAVCVLSRHPCIGLIESALRPVRRDAPVAAFLASAAYRRLSALALPRPAPVDLFAPAAPVVEPLAAPPGDVDFRLLFRLLHPTRVLRALEALVSERRVLVASATVAHLTPVCQSLLALLYPFQWTYLYVPVLPVRLFQYLQCPTPFLMGVHSAFKGRARDFIDDTVLLDLDTDEIDGLASGPVFPPEVQQRLLATMARLYRPAAPLAPAPPSRSACLRWNFLVLWAHIMCGYRAHCYYLPEAGHSDAPAVLFDRVSFIQSRPAVYRSFLKAFTHTSFFAAFLQPRVSLQGRLHIGGVAVEFLQSGLRPLEQQAFDDLEERLRSGAPVDSRDGRDEARHAARVAAWRRPDRERIDKMTGAAEAAGADKDASSASAAHSPAAAEASKVANILGDFSSLFDCTPSSLDEGHATPLAEL